MHRGKTEAMEIAQSLIECSENVKFAAPIYDAAHVVQRQLGIPFEKDRLLLQALGGWGRATAPKFWIYPWQTEVHRLLEVGTVVLCDDLRRLNEAQAVRELGGIIIKIEGPCRGEGVNASDESELEIDLIKADYTIHNTEDLSILKEDVENIIRGIING